MKLKRSDILKVDAVFSSIIENRLNPEAAFLIASNVIMTNEVSDKIKKAYKPVDGFKEYSEKRVELIKSFGGVDIGNGSFEVKNSEGLMVALDKLEGDHTVIVGNQHEYDEKFNKAIEAAEEVDLKPITLDDLAGCDISGADMRVLITAGLISNGSDS
jgi:hypothetical protein